MALHPDEHLETEAVVALGIGIALFVGGGALAWARGSGHLLWPRLGILAVFIVALVLVAEEQPVVVVSVTAAAMLAIVFVEAWRSPALSPGEGAMVTSEAEAA